MLDIHVLMTGTNREWEEQCLASITTAMAEAPYPVSLTAVEGIAGHIGQGRARGYSIGDFPYVTYVDNDDYIMPNAFSALRPALAQGPDAIFPAEYTMQNGHLGRGLQRHHLPVYRRDQIIDHTQWRALGDLVQEKSVAGRDVIEVSEPLYVHRLYCSPGRLLRRANPEEWRRARGERV